jgi:hypothetical protein
LYKGFGNLTLWCRIYSPSIYTFPYEIGMFLWKTTFRPLILLSSTFARLMTAFHLNGKYIRIFASWYRLERRLTLLFPTKKAEVCGQVYMLYWSIKAQCSLPFPGVSTSTCSREG